MLEETRYLPAEVLRIIFSHLDDEDLITCSEVNVWWYQTVKELLVTRSHLELCRWPDVFTSAAENVCLAGCISTDHIPKRRLRRLKSVKIWTGDSTPSALELAKLLTSCKNLVSLELINLCSFGRPLAETILEHCQPELRLKVTLQPQCDSWREAADLLEDNRELLEEILIENKADRALTGWWPIPSTESSFCIPAQTRTASFNCPGLHSIKCTDRSIESLTLHNCQSLNESSLCHLSFFNLHTLAIDNYNTSEKEWLQCFTNGLPMLNSLSLTRCTNITGYVLEALSNKNLKCLKIEVKPLVEPSISNLYKLDFLEILEIISVQITTNVLTVGVSRHWSKLRKFSVEESLFGYRCEVQAIENLREAFKLRRDVEFSHRIRWTELSNEMPKSTGVN